MGTLILAGRTLLAITFALAAIAKLLARSESRDTFREFGAGELLSGLGSILLAPAELAVAVALMLVPTARWAAGVAVALLITFLAGIANALRQGRRPACGCFGALTRKPIGIATLARNAGLLALALYVVAYGPGPAVDHWVSGRGVIAVPALAAVALGITAAFWFVMRSGRAAAADRSVPATRQAVRVGTPAPEFSLVDERGIPRAIGRASADELPLLLVFASAGCGPCRELLAEVGRWQRIFESHIDIFVVEVDDAEGSQALLVGSGARDVLTRGGSRVRNAYGVLATPAAVAVAPDGTVASTVAVGRDAIEDLLRLTLRQFDPMYGLWSQTTAAT